MPASNYLAVIGPQTVWPETAAAIQLADIKDELSKTITVIEVPYGVPWLSPVDITDEDAATLWVDITAMPPSHHTEGRNVLMADGRVRFLSPKLISRETWAALFMRQGGETISELELGDQTRRK